MSITLEPLRPGHPDMARVRALNEIAFPPNERTPVEYMLGTLEGMDQRLLGVYADGAFAGFFTLLVREDCAYIGYFAIVPEARSKGLGGQALRALQDLFADRQIVVDFEAPDPNGPDYELRRRRRAFYLRNGFRPTGYYQYYMEQEFEIACSRPDYDRPAYERLVADLHARVPEFNPVHYRKD